MTRDNQTGRPEDYGPKSGSSNYVDGLSAFLKSRGTTLLIKGYAGAGKTTLALQLLGSLSGRGSGAYISSRVSQEKLSAQLPWLIKKEIKKKSSFDFRDIRLGTGSSIMEEVLEIAHGGKGVEAIVLDTWDGLAKEMFEKERLKAEKMLVGLADSARVRMIFVSEEPGRTTMDYLVDGIVELVRSEQHDRVFREIEVHKLRGTLIGQHKYLYTLAGGRFAHFKGYQPVHDSRQHCLPPLPDNHRMDGVYYSFGSKDLDAALGGIRKASVFALEYAEAVPYTAIRTLELGALINFLNMGRSVALGPLPGVGESDIESIIRPFVDPDVFGKRLILMSSFGKVRTLMGEIARKNKPLAKSVLAVDGFNEAIEDTLKSIQVLKRNSKDGSLMHIQSLSMVENAMASNTSQLLEALSLRISGIHHRGSSDAMLLLLQSDSTIRSRVLAMSYQHARLFAKDRSIVLLGEKPATEAYVVEHTQVNQVLPSITKIV